MWSGKAGKCRPILGFESIGSLDQAQIADLQKVVTIMSRLKSVMSGDRSYQMEILLDLVVAMMEAVLDQ